jgi:hypothetical protein
MTTAQVDKAASPAPAIPVDQAARLRQWRDRTAVILDRWISAADTALHHNNFWITVVAAILVLQAVLAMGHQPWLDEWQGLQISLQTPQLSDLFLNLRYEGHPPLWYLILRGLGQWLHDPATILAVAALAIALPVQLTILLIAPFRRIDRVMITLSEFVMFEFFTVSRSLTLGVALMIVTIAVWQRRGWPWLGIALLPLCDFLFGVISILFIALRLREKRTDWPLASFWAISSIVSAWTVRPMPDIVPAILPTKLFRNFSTWCASIGDLGLPMQWHVWSPQWNNPPPIGIGGLAAAGFLTVVWLELRSDKLKLIAFFAIMLLTLSFNLWVYPFAVRHLDVLAVLLICLIWHGRICPAQGSHKPTIWFSAWLLVAALCGMVTAAINMAVPFDRSREAVSLIRQLGLRDRTWVSFPRYTRQGIPALSGMPFERLTQHCSETFIRWNDRAEKRVRNIPALYRALGEKRDQDGQFYFLSSLTIPPVPGLLRQIGKVEGGYDGQNFVLYVVGEGHPSARPHGQSCAGTLASLPRVD